jgi:hypothetical protein
MKAKLSIALAMLLILTLGSIPGYAQNSDPEQTLIQKGLQIAPVPLNLSGRNVALVGLGSYIVNARSDCNSCHNGGQPPNFDFAAGGNPYMFMPGTNLPQPKKLDPTVYLGGGQIFGTADGNDPTPDNPLIVSRNLTPDKTGLAEGGHTLAEFMQIIRTGIDMDHVHPNLPSGIDGNLLQIMPWPTFQNMTDLDLQAIYEYLSAIPCVEGGPGEPPNRCATGAPTLTAVAGPKNVSVGARQFQLDGTASTISNGAALSYSWSIPQGSPQAAISGANTATPIVQFTVRGTYTFQLTISDSAGHSATDTVMVNYVG